MRNQRLLPLALGLLVHGCTSDALTVDAEPTGQSLLFTREQHLFVAAADGTGERQLTTEGLDFSATWSPDGKRIAFARGSASVPGVSLFSITSKGDGLTELLSENGLLQATQDGSDLGGLSWSPDGTSLAFHAIDLWVPSVFVMPVAERGASCPDGPNTCWLPPISKVVEQGVEPAWSPDGKSLVFATYDGVWIVASDGSNLRRLVSSRSASDPVWSSTGDVIAISIGDAEADIFTIRPDGSELRAVTNLEGREVHPTFSPDAATIAFSHRTGASSDVFRLDRATGATTRLIENADAPVYQP